MYNQTRKCEHDLKHNTEQDFVFCIKCGMTWKNNRETRFIEAQVPQQTTPTHYQDPYTHPYTFTGTGQ